MQLQIVLALAAVFVCSAYAADPPRVVCYYSSWAIYRVGAGKFTVGDIDPTLCTHVVYAFAGLLTTGDATLLDPWNDEQQFKQLLVLKKVNPDLKLILAIGGYNHGPGPFQEVVRKPVKRAIFVDSAFDLLTQYGFDGLDIDWEYQDSVGGTPADKTGLTALLNEMRVKFDTAGYLISIATPPNFNLIDVCYELANISKAVDFISVMSYDFHGSWETVTGHVTPLHADPAGSKLLSVEALINYYIEQGADPAKLNLGLITYGRSFTLTNPISHGLGSPALGPGNMGAVVPENGVLAYADVCLNKWNATWDTTQAVPYASEGNQWVGYDDPDSLAAKIEFGKSVGISNVMVWSLESDDFNGNCGGKTFPLLRAINDNINA